MQSKNQTPAVVAAEQSKQITVLNHSITAMLTVQQTGGAYYTFTCVTPPGQGIPLHYNEEGDAIVAIVDGEYSVMIGDKRYHALKGDVCFFPKRVPHSFQNIGTKASTTIWTVTPGKNFEQFFNALSNLPAGDPDPAMMAKIFADNRMSIVAPAMV
jgi:quercetin dioxygenase-like cupin family protein